MIGLFFYILAMFLYMGDPVTNLWLVALGIGLLFHWKYVLAGTLAFLLGAGFKRPF